MIDGDRTLGRSVRLSRSRIVRIEAILAATLLSIALVWDAARGLGMWASLWPSVKDVLTGLGTASVLCLSLPFFTSTWASRVLWLRQMRVVWDEVLTPFGRSLTVAEIAVIAALSGLSEEVFFRGILQAEIGIIGAAILFGLLHPLNLSYVIWATCVGCAFGLLYRMTGSLIPPVLCHAGYNLAALLYLRYWAQNEKRQDLLLAG